MSAPAPVADRAPVVGEVTGPVRHGDRRGRELGYPTANLPADVLRVPDGVYAGTLVRTDRGSSHLAAVSVGHRPTFYGRDGERLLEAHLLDFEGDLYGEHVTVRLHRRLRPQRRFADVAALLVQLREDVDQVRAGAR